MELLGGMNSRFGIIGFLLGISLSVLTVVVLNKIKERINKTRKFIGEGEKI